MSKSRAEINDFFHDQVDIGTGNSADYVVAHATRQKQRGRNPSAHYKDLTDPRNALAAAQADIGDRESSIDSYTAAFSGRIALIRVWSEQQRDIAHGYAEARLEDNGAPGAIIKNIEHGETLQAPLHFRVTGHGTVELMLPF